MFNIDERIDMLREATAHIANIREFLAEAAAIKLTGYQRLCTAAYRNVRRKSRFQRQLGNEPRTARENIR